MILDDCEHWDALRIASRHWRTFEDEEDVWKNAQDLIAEDASSPTEMAARWESSASVPLYDDAEIILDPILEKSGIKIDRQDAEYKMLCMKAMKVGIATYKEFADQTLSDKADGELTQLLASQPQGEILPPHGSGDITLVNVVQHVQGMNVATLPTISEGFAQLTKEKSKSSWQGKTMGDVLLVQRHMLDYFGDIPLHQITKVQAKGFQAALGELPSLLGKGRFKGMGMKEAIDAANAIEEAIEGGTFPQSDMSWSGLDGDKVRRLNLVTVNKHTSNISIPSMGIAFAICRTAKIRSLSALEAHSGHAARTRETLNATPALIPSNQVLVGTGNPAQDALARLSVLPKATLEHTLNLEG